MRNSQLQEDQALRRSPRHRSSDQPSSRGHTGPTARRAIRDPVRSPRRPRRGRQGMGGSPHVLRPRSCRRHPRRRPRSDPAGWNRRPWHSRRRRPRIHDQGMEATEKEACSKMHVFLPAVDGAKDPERSAIPREKSREWGRRIQGSRIEPRACCPTSGGCFRRRRRAGSRLGPSKVGEIPLANGPGFTLIIHIEAWTCERFVNSLESEIRLGTFKSTSPSGNRVPAGETRPPTPGIPTSSQRRDRSRR